MSICCCCVDSSADDAEMTRLMKQTESQRGFTNSYQGVSPRSNNLMAWTLSGDFTSNVNVVTTQLSSVPPKLTLRTVNVASVDKRFQDHASLYNSLVEQLEQLDGLVLELWRMFPEHNPQRTLEGAFKHLAHLIGSDNHSVSVVSAHKDSACPQITYEPDKVPYQAIPAFIAFNACSRLIRQLVAKCPAVSGSVRLVLDDQRKLMRDVMMASLGADGPKCIASCRENLERLREVGLSGIDSIEHRTGILATQLKTSADLLHSENLL